MATEEKEISKTIAVSLDNWQFLNQVKIDNNLDNLDDAVTFVKKAQK